MHLLDTIHLVGKRDPGNKRNVHSFSCHESQRHHRITIAVVLVHHRRVAHYSLLGKDFGLGGYHVVQVEGSCCHITHRNSLRCAGLGSVDIVGEVSFRCFGEKLHID